MAEIRPLRAWRYAQNLTNELSELVSPLFDVVSAKQRALLYGNPNNSIHISVPQNVPNKAGSYESVGKTLENWKINNIIKQDNLPAIYVIISILRFLEAIKNTLERVLFVIFVLMILTKMLSCATKTPFHTP